MSFPCMGRARVDIYFRLYVDDTLGRHTYCQNYGPVFRHRYFHHWCHATYLSERGETHQSDSMVC